MINKMVRINFPYKNNRISRLVEIIDGDNGFICNMDKVRTGEYHCIRRRIIFKSYIDGKVYDSNKLPLDSPMLNLFSWIHGAYREVG